MKKILIFINVDWFLISHFSKYLEHLVSEGYDVTVISSSTGLDKKIVDIGAKFIDLNIARGYGNLLKEITALLKIAQIIREANADYVELITIKMIIYGGLACLLTRFKNKSVFYVSGLGTMFTGTRLKGRLKQAIILLIYKFIFSTKNSGVIVENDDDKSFLLNNLKIREDKIFLVPGAGVDLDVFSQKAYNEVHFNSSNARVVMISRLLRDKGLVEFCEAAQIVKKDFPSAEFIVAGNIDPTNPTSFSWSDCEKYPEVRFLGHVENVSSLLKTCDIFVLPSYREGFPRAIMEASAVGLPSVVSDVPGCRAALIDSVTGIMVPVKNSYAIAKAIEDLLSDNKRRVEMGNAARRHAEAYFSVSSLAVQHHRALVKVPTDL